MTTPNIFEACAFAISIYLVLAIASITIDSIVKGAREQKAQKAVERRHQQLLIDAREMARLTEERQAKLE